MKRIIFVLIALTFVLADCPALTASAKGSDEAEIKALEQRIADAANARDPDAIMKNYLGGEGLFVFDVIPPRQYVGADAFRKDWEGFFGGFHGPITFENSDMTVESDGKMAFVHYMTHVAGKRKDGNPIDFNFRVTDVLRKAEGNWVIVHEHVSVPVDLATGKADLASKP